MKVLFDTNILIALEKPGEILPESLAEMVRLARELKYDICVHPAQVEDLKRGFTCVFRKCPSCCQN